MGLDMYLTKRVYIGANYSHNNVTGKVDIKSNGVPVKIQFKRISEIIEEVGYWRKANAIHNWFVKNCQDGKDECRDTWVATDKLEELLEVCKQVKKDHSLAGTLLPPESGFFFGSTEIDRGYFQDIEYTIGLLEKLFKENLTAADIYYRSSW